MNNDVKIIAEEALKAALPDTAVQRALKQINFNDGRIILIAAGKASWQMAKTAYDQLENRIDCGAVVTKYQHSKGRIGKLKIFEAGHPVSDINSYKATQYCIELVKNLKKNDNVLFLLSGGGSALFEMPLIPGEESQDITKQLLSCGADIVEINTIRKRLSSVKGGRFAQLCEPAHVYTIVLSDIIGDPLDMIASGPTYPDSSTKEQAQNIVEKYGIKLSDMAKEYLKRETPKKLYNVDTFITGSVKQLCISASESAKKLGYEPIFLTASLNCEAREAGRFLASIAKDNSKTKNNIAYILGGETVVHLTGKGKGGRNQELVLSAAQEIEGLENCTIFSFGSDGTDGPTDAAGAWADGTTAKRLKMRGLDINTVLQNNDSYNALKAVDSLIVTGPTGTNVNDLTVLLIKGK